MTRVNSITQELGLHTRPLPVTSDSAAPTHTVFVDVHRIVLHVLFPKVPCSHHGTLMFINFSWPLPPLFCYRLSGIPFPILYLQILFTFLHWFISRE